MIDVGETKAGLWKEITGGNTDLLHCFTCGQCVAGCPASNANPPLLIRSLVRMVVYGLEDELLDEDTPWTCVSCSRCEEVCPMDVKPFEVGLAIRRWQCHNDETRLPMAIVDLYKRGYTQAVGEVGELREELGLPPAPVITDQPKLLEAYRNLIMQVPLVSDNSYMFGD